LGDNESSGSPDELAFICHSENRSFN